MKLVSNFTKIRKGKFALTCSSIGNKYIMYIYNIYTYNVSNPYIYMMYKATSKSSTFKLSFCAIIITFACFALFLKSF